MSLYLWLYSQSLHHRSRSPPNPSTISIWYWFKATQNIKRTWVSTSNNTFSIDHFHHIHSKKINIPTTKNFINPILTTTFLCKTRSWRQQKNGSRGNPPKPFTFVRLSASQQLLVMEPWPPGCQNPPVLMGWWDGIFLFHSSAKFAPENSKGGRSAPKGKGYCSKPSSLNDGWTQCLIWFHEMICC